jgi:hypothetical protein
MDARGCSPHAAKPHVYRRFTRSPSFCLFFADLIPRYGINFHSFFKRSERKRRVERPMVAFEQSFWPFSI